MLNVRLLSGISCQWQKVALGCRHEDLCTLQEKYDACYLSSSRKPSPKPTQEGFFALFERSVTHTQNAFAPTLAIRRWIISETASDFTCWRENSATWFDDWQLVLLFITSSCFLSFQYSRSFHSIPRNTLLLAQVWSAWTTMYYQVRLLLPHSKHFSALLELKI